MTEMDFCKKIMFKAPEEFETLPLDIRIAAFALVEGTHYQIRRHIHPECEIMIPLRGNYRSRLNGKRLDVRPHEFILIQTGDDHEDLCEGDFLFAALRFSIQAPTGTERTLPILNRELSPEERIFPIRDESSTALLFREVQTASFGRNPFRTQATGPLTRALFWELLALVPQEMFSREFRTAFRRDHLLSRLEEVFSTHLTENLPVERIAALLGMSRRVLEYRLKQLGAPSPRQLFLRRRIQEAVLLLKYEGMNVGETAERLGFANAFHFSRVFKSVTGRSPAAYLPGHAGRE